MADAQGLELTPQIFTIFFQALFDALVYEERQGVYEVVPSLCHVQNLRVRCLRVVMFENPLNMGFKLPHHLI